MVKAVAHDHSPSSGDPNASAASGVFVLFEIRRQFGDGYFFEHEHGGEVH
jgi:hypothetical protein